MTNSSTFVSKGLLLGFLCSLSFFASDAQQRRERIFQRNDNPQRNQPPPTPPGRNREFQHRQSENNNDRVSPQRSPIDRHDRWQPGPRNNEPGRQYPGPRSQQVPDRRDQAQRFPHVDRDYRERRTRVAPAPRYAYYNNGYHHYYRPPVYNAHNPCWRYNYLPARRTVISAFPFAYETINYGGCGYRFYNGTFYRPYNSAYIVVAPPIGLSINILPFGYRRIYVHDYSYYYYNGTYYDDYDDGYRVVAPPVDAVVESIPPGYETVTIDGETYYVSDGVQYKPEVQENGEIWYRVIKVN